MPRGSEPYEDSEITELLVEYSDPKVWCQMERGDMVRDVNRLAVTAREARADLESYMSSWNQLDRDAAILRRTVYQLRRIVENMEMPDDVRNVLLNRMNTTEDPLAVVTV